MGRVIGKTFITCVKICLSQGDPLTIPYHIKVDSQFMITNSELLYLVGEDIAPARRYSYFYNDLKYIYMTGYPITGVSN